MVAFTDLTLQHRKWTKNGFFISTDAALIPIASLNAMFASEDVYWAMPMPEEVMRITLQNSLCFGMYEMEPRQTCEGGGSSEGNGKGVARGLEEIGTSESSSKDELENHPDEVAASQREAGPKFIGIARCITDFTTFIYLTDVYIYPSYQAKGLGRWLISCVQEVIESMPYLRRSLLFTGDWKRSVPFYEKTMGMTVLESRRNEDGAGGEGVAVLMRLGEGCPAYKSGA